MFEDIARDSRSSASVLTRVAAQRLADLAESSTAADPGTFWEELYAAARELIAAKREMASIINLVGRALAAGERTVLSGVSSETSRHAVYLECLRAWESADETLECLGKEGAGLVPTGGTVATVSSSESVRAILARAAGAGTDFRVLVPESRPAREGVAFAESLPAWDIPVTLVADAALPGLVDRCQLVLVGADSVSENDFVHKVGTLPLAPAAREHDVPVYVAALLDKFLPSGLRGTPDRLHDESEVLPDRPAGVAVENRYFEVIPHSLIRGFVTEDGIIQPPDVQARIAARPVTPVLLELLFPREGALREADVLPETALDRD